MSDSKIWRSCTRSYPMLESALETESTGHTCSNQGINRLTIPYRYEIWIHCHILHLDYHLAKL